MIVEHIQVGGSLDVIPASGARLPQRGGRFGEGSISQLLPAYAELAKRGMLFTVSQPPAGAVTPIYTNAAQQFLIYNPENSGIDIHILRAWIGYVSTTTAAGHFCYAGAVGQSAPGTTTNANIQNGYLKAPGAAGNKGNYYTPGSPNVAFVAANYIRPFGVSMVAQTAAGTNAPFTMYDELEGSLIIPEKGVLAIAGNIAILGVHVIGALVAEIPK